MGPKFIAKVEDVKKLLSDADGYYNSGRYDLAFKKYEQVLNLDPYNVAARRGEERINLTKTHYGEEAYNETRSRASSGRCRRAGKSRSANTARPSVRSATPSRAMRAARRGSRTSSTASSFRRSSSAMRASGKRSIFCASRRRPNDPATEGKRGVDIVLRTASLGRAAAARAGARDRAASAGSTAGRGRASSPPRCRSRRRRRSRPPTRASRITLNQIPLGEALRYIASQAGLKVKVEPYAVSIIPISEQSSDLFTKEYRVPPGFISSSVNIGANPLDRPATGVGQRCGRRQGYAGIDRWPAVGQPPDRARFSEGSGRPVSARCERELSPAEQPVDRAEYGREPRTGRCAGGTGQRCRPEAGRDRSEVCRDHAKQPEGARFRLVARASSTSAIRSVFGSGGTSGTLTGPEFNPDRRTILSSRPTDVPLASFR